MRRMIGTGFGFEPELSSIASEVESGGQTGIYHSACILNKLYSTVTFVRANVHGTRVARRRGLRAVQGKELFIPRETPKCCPQNYTCAPKSSYSQYQQSRKPNLHRTHHNKDSISLSRLRQKRTSPFATLSQNLLSLQTLPTPTLSSHRRTPSSRDCTSPLHEDPTNRLSPSLTRSRSTALRRATSAGATGTAAAPAALAEHPPPYGTHSGGSTLRATRASGEGRLARRCWRRMDTRERASFREMTVVLVMKMERRMRSAREGREGEVSRGGRTARVRRRRRRWRIGARARRRRRWDVWEGGVSVRGMGVGRGKRGCSLSSSADSLVAAGGGEGGGWGGAKQAG